MKVFILLVSFFVSTQGYGQARNNAVVKKATHFTGIASYYHPKFHGRKMANGETYQHHELSAASNVIPLHKWVKVTNTKNGRTVIVKIKDRMAKKNKRLIDLSYGAAKQLKMTGHGIVKVRVEVLRNYAPGKK